MIGDHNGTVDWPNGCLNFIVIFKRMLIFFVIFFLNLAFEYVPDSEMTSQTLGSQDLLDKVNDNFFTVHFISMASNLNQK